jgi:hypothetical protein
MKYSKYLPLFAVHGSQALPPLHRPADRRKRPHAGPQPHGPFAAAALLSLALLFSPAITTAAIPPTARPADLELVDSVLSSPDPIDPARIRDLWSALAQKQQPVISREDLAAIIKAQRSALNNAVLDFDVTSEPLTGSGQKTAAHYRSMLSGNKAYMQSQAGPTLDKLGPRTVMAYDGTALRVLQEQTKGLHQGGIEPLQSRKGFFSPDHLLASAMLLDSERDLGQKWPVYDLVAMLEQPVTIVLEQRETVDGVNAVVVTDMRHRIYLDPDRDFAVVRTEQWQLAKDQNGKPVNQKLAYARNNRNLVDSGNGIWLPKEVEQTWFKDGKPTDRSVTRAAEAKLNASITDDDFRNIFPYGTSISDAINDLRFINGGDNSISRLLSDELEAQLGRSATANSTKPDGSPQATALATQTDNSTTSTATQTPSARTTLASTPALGWIRNSAWTVAIVSSLLGSMLGTVLFLRRRQLGGAQ